MSPRRAHEVLTLLVSGLVLAGLAVACGGTSEEPREAAGEPTATAAPLAEPATEPAVAAPAGERRRPRVVFLGDSLTAGYGLDADQAFPHLVGERLAAEGHPIEVVNAGVSGDTTAGGLARLDWLLRREPDVMMVTLGANDGLRGLPLASSEANLRAIVERARAAGVRVLLGGMLIPPNYGPEYSERFRDLYPRLAEELDVPRIPFLLDGVAADRELNLADGIHPNAEGHRRIVETVLPYLRELVIAAETETTEAAPAAEAALSPTPAPGA